MDSAFQTEYVLHQHILPFQKWVWIWCRCGFSALVAGNRAEAEPCRLFLSRRNVMSNKWPKNRDLPRRQGHPLHIIGSTEYPPPPKTGKKPYICFQCYQLVKSPAKKQLLKLSQYASIYIIRNTYKLWHNCSNYIFKASKLQIKCHIWKGDSRLCQFIAVLRTYMRLLPKTVFLKVSKQITLMW